MRKNRSEIFEDYMKIMEDAGLVSLSSDPTILDDGKEKADSSKEKSKMSKEMKEYMDSSYARNGSDDLDVIQALYGVKPDPAEAMEYENNIMEIAHPKPVIIGPAYDRLNALVENNIERQNIMSNIALKPTSGNITGHRYASQNLILTLVKIANDADARDNEAIRKLADDCITELSGLKKEAVAPVAAVGLLGTIFAPEVLIPAAIVLGGIWLYSHLDDPNKGLKANIKNALAQLDDLKTNSWYESDIDATVQRDVSILEHQMSLLLPYVNEFDQVMSEIYKPVSLSNLDSTDISKVYQTASEKGGAIKSSLENFKIAIEETEPMLGAAIENFSSRDYQLEHTDPSFMSEISGYLGEALHGRWGLIANDFQSAVNALDTLKSSLEEAHKKIDALPRVQEQFKSKLEDGVAKLKSGDEGGDKHHERGDLQYPRQESVPATHMEGQPEESNKALETMLKRKPTAEELEFYNSL